MVKRITTNQQEPDVQDVTAKPDKPDYSALDALEQQAAQTEQAGATEANEQTAKQEQKEVDTLKADLLSALDIAAAAAEPAMWWLTPDQFEKLWGKSVRAAIAEPGAEVMRRHGLNMGGLMTQYGPYIGLAGALGPSVAATDSVYKQKQKQLPNEGENGSTEKS